MKGYIYRLTNTLNNKVYIGQTIDLDRRYKEHIYYSEHNSPMQIHAAIRKHGIINFRFDVIHTVQGEEDEVKLKLNMLESQEILAHNSYKIGYNASLGGEGNYGLVHSEASRKIIGEKSRNRSAESNKKIGDAIRGRIMPESEKLMRKEICKRASAARWPK